MCLARDYFYPALVRAPFVLACEGLMELGQAWRLMSCNPAQVVDLHDRGSIEPGKRADLILVDMARGELPLVRMVLVDGEPVFSSGLAWICLPA